MEVSYVGFLTNKITDVMVKANQDTKLDVEFTEIDIKVITCFRTNPYIIPLIEQDNTTSGERRRGRALHNLPIKNIHEISVMIPGLSLDRY